MDKRILKRVCICTKNPEKLLSCCKQFTVDRKYNIRWKNRIYFRDNRIKIVNSKIYIDIYTIKNIWYNNGVIHRDDIDPVNGLTFPAKTSNYLKEWYKDGEKHRDDIDPVTGQTLPASIDNNNRKTIWIKDGLFYRDDIDPNTGFTLPAKIWGDEYEMLYKYVDDIDPETGLLLYTEIDEDFCMVKIQIWNFYGIYHRDEIDPDTGFILPAHIKSNGTKFWYKYGKPHRDEIDPETRCVLPAAVTIDGVKYWYKDGIEFTPKK